MPQLATGEQRPLSGTGHGYTRAIVSIARAGRKHGANADERRDNLNKRDDSD